MNNPILTAFGRVDILDGFDSAKHIIAVKSGEKIIGQVLPERPGYHEMAYYQPYNKVTPIGPTFDADAMKHRLTNVMFGGDEAKFREATLAIIKK